MPAEMQAQARKLLEGATAPDTWYFQPGWGLQFAPEPGTLGLLVPDDAPAKTGDLLLMEAAPKLAGQVVELAGEVQRLRDALLHASPMLRAGIKYHQQSGHAAHALPGTRDRDHHQQLAGNALWEIRLASHQGGAERALAALATQEAHHDD